MPLFDAFASRLARPAGRVLDAPIRDIVLELLKEHGYASPAEVQALRDELRGLKGRVETLDRKVGELVDIATQARAEAAATREHVARHTHAVPSHEHAADPKVAALEGEVRALVARLAELEGRPAAAPAAAASAPAPLSAAPRGGCKVPGCDEGVRSKGFCSAHYQQWRRGTLKSFVNADGTALVDGRVVHFPASAAGGHVTSRDGRFHVDGAAVTEIGAG